MNRFIELNIIQENEIAYYLYGLRHLEMLVVTTGFTFLIAILLNEVIFTGAFLVTFALLRVGWKGGHAKSKTRCFTYSFLLFFSGVVIKKNVWEYWNIKSMIRLISVLLVILLVISLKDFIKERNTKRLKKTLLITYIVILLMIIGRGIGDVGILDGIGYACFSMILVRGVNVQGKRE